MKQEQTSVEIFNRMAKHYDLFNLLSSFGIEKIWRAKLKTIIVPKGNILDFGCGAGEFSKIIKHDNCNFIGLDPSLKMLKKGKSTNNFLKYANGYGENLPFKKDSFDYIISGFVFRNLKDAGKSLSEIKRVLKPKGKLIILDFIWPENPVFSAFFTLYLKYVLPFFYMVLGGNRSYIKYFYSSIKNFYSKKEFGLLLKKHGFDNIKYLN